MYVLLFIEINHCCLTTDLEYALIYNLKWWFLPSLTGIKQKDMNVGKRWNKRKKYIDKDVYVTCTLFHFQMNISFKVNDNHATLHRPREAK